MSSSGEMFTYPLQTTSAELAMLSGGAPDQTIEIVSDELDFSSGQQTGRPSLAYVDNASGRHLAVVKEFGTDRGLTEAEAQELLQGWFEYNGVLVAYGYDQPEIYEASIQHKLGGYVIRAAEAFVLGPDGAKMLRNPNALLARKFSLIERVIAQQYGAYYGLYLRRREVEGYEATILPVGSDLKADNLILDEDIGGQKLIDTFPPKLLDREGFPVLHFSKLDRYSPSAIRMLCGTREGSLLRLWRSAEPLLIAAEQERQTQNRISSQELQDWFVGYIELQCRGYGAPTQEIELIRRQLVSGYDWFKRVADNR